MNYYFTIKVKRHEYFEPKIYYIRWGPKIIQRWQIKIATSCCNWRYRGLPSRQRNPAWFNKPQHLVSINQSQTSCTTRATKKEHSVQITSYNFIQMRTHSPQNNFPWHKAPSACHGMFIWRYCPPPLVNISHAIFCACCKYLRQPTDALSRTIQKSADSSLICFPSLIASCLIRLNHANTSMDLATS